MRTKFLFAAIALGVGTLASAMPAEARINQRQGNQQHRIWHGVGTGELTAREAYRLERQQAHIARYERRSRADGPGLTGRERYRLERMQDRASRNIYRQRHDRQDRW
ncbi:hypothetical protein RCO27_07505 [Sphingosinicella sp. LHD-64]|uniref:hypothetical protein n=1 Tax=Sphingosinicella sp. LHD-64 TaxID=3072139 RepID=UPI00280C587D|nr:hypothetical protein [Sphingosinicella sp. LHD-64]MDQ8756074.1 hypothetical protein [Sphingosinicella sp. LHD-64]